MSVWERLKQSRKHRKEIDAQIERIETLNRNLPDQSLEMELMGYMPQEYKNLEQAEQWLAVLKTEDLRRKTSRYGVDMPDPVDSEYGLKVDWDDHEEEPYYLTSKGMKVVNLALREEEKYRWDKWNARIAATTAPLSLIVAILALVFGK